MIHSPLFSQIRALKIIPVLSVYNADIAANLANTLTEGGLPVAEITFRTPAATQVITRMRKAQPDMLIGAGTVLNTDDLKKAIDAGASFGVAPGSNRAVIEEAIKLNFPFCPGILTPTDIEAVLSYSLQVLKFFPAEPAGGINMLKSLIAPYAHTGIQFMPTGGISPDMALTYLKIPEVVAVGGSWIASKEDMQQENWKKILGNCRKAAEMQR